MKITIGHPFLTPDPPSQRAASQFTTTDALIDTGAQRTILSPEAVEKIGLFKIDETTLIRVGGKERADVYAASLQFPHSGLSTVATIAVPCCELSNPLFRCLLGRDVLSRWTFTYDGPTGTWHIKEEAGTPFIEPPEGFDPNLWGK
jgi:predicted aspartyl protease